MSNMHLEVIVENATSQNSPLWAGLLTILALATIKHLRLPGIISGDTAGDPPRFGEIDGLRGVLAFSVFLTHAASTYRYRITGEWKWPSSPFYTMLGFVPVSLFFMITGFLFWGRVIDGKLKLPEFYIGRILRLIPLYLFALAILLIYVGIVSDWQLAVAPSQLITDVAKWSTLGVLGRPDLNGVDRTALINTATWTLRPEAIFYALLPAGVLIAGPRRFSLAFAIVSIGIVATSGVLGGSYWINFAFGMAAAHLFKRFPTIDLLKSTPITLLCVGILTIICMTKFYGYGLAYAALCFPIFLSVLYGNSFFGTLRLREVRWLGEMSYSIYLLHCPLLFGSFLLIDAIFGVENLTPMQYWASCAAVTVSLVLISTLTYVAIERPFMKLKPSKLISALRGPKI